MKNKTKSSAGVHTTWAGENQTQAGDFGKFGSKRESSCPMRASWSLCTLRTAEPNAIAMGKQRTRSTVAPGTFAAPFGSDAK